MKSGFEIQLRNVTLGCLAASITLLTVFLGYRAYADLYGVILQGFDRKLKAIASSTSLLIDSEAHRLMERPYRLEGLAYDAKSGALRAMDGDELGVLHIDGASASVVGREESPLPRGVGFTWDPKAQRGWVLDADGRLWTEDKRKRQVYYEGFEGFGCRGLAWVASERAFYCAAEGTLMRYTPSRDQVARQVGRLEIQYDWLALESPEVLIGYAPSLGQVRRIRLPAQRGARRGATNGPALDAESNATDPAKATVLLQLPSDLLAETTAGGLAWDGADGRGWLALDRLIEIRPGAWSERADAPGYRSEASALYLQHVHKMRRIREAAHITYLYTQIPHSSDPSRCIYILDASIGEAHSNLGDEDDLPEENVEGQRAVLQGEDLFLSPVRPWDQWGLLKVAFAPIEDRHGDIHALTGADVNISIIRQKTRENLIRVLFSGLLCLAIGGFVAFAVARRTIEPVAQVNEAALKIAAGNFGQRIRQGRLAELASLAGSFNGIGETLERTAVRSVEQDEETEHLRCGQVMAHRLQSLVATARGAEHLAWTHRGGGRGTWDGVDGGALGVLLWWRSETAQGSGSTAEAEAQHAYGLRWVAMRDLKAAAGDGKRLAQCLEGRFPVSVEIYLWCSGDGREMRWVARSPLIALHLKVDGTIDRTSLEGVGAAILEPASARLLGPAVPAVDDDEGGLVRQLISLWAARPRRAADLLEQLKTDGDQADGMEYWVTLTVPQDLESQPPTEDIE